MNYKRKPDKKGVHVLAKSLSLELKVSKGGEII